MKGFDVESNAQGIAFDMRHLDVPGVKKSILVFKNVLAQIGDDLLRKSQISQIFKDAKNR